MERPAAAPPAPWPPRFYEHLKNIALGKANQQPTGRPSRWHSSTPSFDAFKLLRATDGTAMASHPARGERPGCASPSPRRWRRAGSTFHYQPVVQARNPRMPAFFEMLARLRLPSGQMLPAGAFLPAVEDGPLGRAIDRLALAHALKALAADPTLRLSVNMSPRSMGDEEWLAILARGARRQRRLRPADPRDHRGRGDAGRRPRPSTSWTTCAAPAAPSRSTTSAPAPPASSTSATSASTWSRSTAPSSSGVHAARDAQVLVECLRAVAQHFEMLTVAERVETEADAAWLRGLGIDCLQGYLYGRPPRRSRSFRRWKARRRSGRPAERRRSRRVG